MTYTYDQFETALNDAGYTFSDADLALAKQYPDAGMAILQYKKDWVSATTDEQRKAANDGANGVRSSYGNYTGGADGAQYYLNDPTPSSYELAEYENPYADQLTSTLERLTNRDSYDSQYEGQINDILSGNYDISSNPMFQSYAKANAREAQRSAQDALGSAAALTGGMASSYATTAASQAADYYNSQTADAVPDILATTLSQLQTQDNTDYQRYLDQIGLTRDDVNTLLSVTAEDYDRFSTQQQLAYQQVLDNLEYAANREDADRNYDLQQTEQDSQQEQLMATLLLQYADVTNDNDPITQYLKKIGYIQ